MFVIVSILSILSSVAFSPNIDIVLLLITLGVIRNMDSKYFILGFILSIVIDIVWGRVFGLSFIIYSLYLYISSVLFLKYPIMRDYGLVIFTFGYTVVYTLMHALINYDLFLWKNAFIWIVTQVLQRHRKNRDFLTTRSVKF